MNAQYEAARLALAARSEERKKAVKDEHARVFAEAAARAGVAKTEAWAYVRNRVVALVGETLSALLGETDRDGVARLQGAYHAYERLLGEFDLAEEAESESETAGA